jgi:hypothetical protein
MHPSYVIMMQHGLDAQMKTARMAAMRWLLQAACPLSLNRFTDQEKTVEELSATISALRERINRMLVRL